MKSVFLSTQRTRRHRQPNPELTEQEPFFSKSTQGETAPAQTAFFQPKLTIGAPNDPYEREADAVADKVVNHTQTDSPAVQSKEISSIQRLATPEEEKMPGTNDERMKEDKMIQEKPEVQRAGAPKMKEDEKMPGLQKMDDPLKEKKKMPGVQKKEVSANEEKDEKTGAASVQMKSDGGATASPHLSSRIESNTGKGRPLPKNTRTEMESSFGADFGGVNIHTGSEAEEMNQSLSAQAFTHGQDVYFNTGKFSPESGDGKRLLAHELTHVVQQSGEIQRNMIQRDLIDPNLETSNGSFNINMLSQEGLLIDPLPEDAVSGLDGLISFLPNVEAPYSNEIGLIQIVKLRDETNTDLDPASMPAGRGASLRTSDDAETGVEGGFFTDALHQNFDDAGNPTDVAAAGSQKGAQYEGGSPIWGFKRSNDPNDIKAAELEDSPGTSDVSSILDFEFETVAKGEDTNTVFGSLLWGFKINAGDVTDEFVSVQDGQSATFDAALELHRDFYVHEPITFYFGFDQDSLDATEIAKIELFKDYLDRFPDVNLSLEGFADRRGDPDYNIDLSRRRVKAVKVALLGAGIDEARIDDSIIGVGATEQFTSGDLAPNEGRSQDLDANRRGNRRVTLTFNHTP